MAFLSDNLLVLPHRGDPDKLSQVIIESLEECFLFYHFNKEINQVTWLSLLTQHHD